LGVLKAGESKGELRCEENKGGIFLIEKMTGKRWIFVQEIRKFKSEDGFFGC
jgi:hypothetical protein